MTLGDFLIDAATKTFVWSVVASPERPMGTWDGVLPSAREAWLAVFPDEGRHLSVHERQRYLRRAVHTSTGLEGGVIGNEH